MRKSTLLLTIIIILFSACQKNALSPENQLTDGYLIVGIYHGECVGNCFKAYKIDDSGVYKAVNVKYFTGPLKDLQWEKLNNQDTQAFENLRNDFPSQLYTVPENYIGMPDAHDQGGWYIETSVDGEKKYWQIDTVVERLPNYLKPYVEKLRFIYTF
jgi:hypothetical protein